MKKLTLLILLAVLVCLPQSVLAAEEIYYNGTIVPSRFDGIMALGDAAEFWNIDDSTLRHAIRNGKFKCGRDITKFGKQWVITIEAMVREYGEPKQ